MLFTGIACSALTVPPLFLACNLGEIVSIAFDTANTTIYQIKWYECPVNLQKCLIPMLLVTEIPYHMPIFGQLDCSRATFKLVRAFSMFWYFSCLFLFFFSLIVSFSPILW